jgi:large subunit ribosomal protein L6
MIEENVIKKEIRIPETAEVKIADGRILVSGPKGELEKNFGASLLDMKVANDSVVVQAKGKKRKAKAFVGTFESHLKNMLAGVTDGFVYKLKINYSHFPIKVSARGNSVFIDNFLGERYPRKARIVGATKVGITKEFVEVSGIDKEAVGQTAANIRSVTKIRNRDCRVFKDGFYLVRGRRGG